MHVLFMCPHLFFSFELLGAIFTRINNSFMYRSLVGFQISLVFVCFSTIFTSTNLALVICLNMQVKSLFVPRCVITFVTWMNDSRVFYFVAIEWTLVCKCGIAKTTLNCLLTWSRHDAWFSFCANQSGGHFWFPHQNEKKLDFKTLHAMTFQQNASSGCFINVLFIPSVVETQYWEAVIYPLSNIRKPPRQYIPR